MLLLSTDSMFVPVKQVLSASVQPQPVEIFFATFERFSTYFEDTLTDDVE